VKPSPAAIAHLEQVVAYINDPSKAPHDSPPQPPNMGVAEEVFGLGWRMLAVILDRLMTGEVHQKPAPLAVLGACDVADMALDGSLTPDKLAEVLRMYGWKGDSDAGT
jgi:hypothetical protein